MTHATRNSPVPNGLREAHAHIPMMGRELSTVRFQRCTSVEECLDALARESSRLDAADPARGRWCVATGARVESWRDPRWPSRDELDRAMPGRCGFVMSFDHHALAANRAAFVAAGIGDGDSDPDGGLIERDATGTTPTGLLLESAAMLVRDAQPALCAVEQEEVVELALNELAGLGFAEVHDMLAPAWLGPVLAELHDQGRLGLRVALYALVDNPHAREPGMGGQGGTIESFHEASARWTRPGAVELLGGKIFVDGTLNSATAWTLTPYVQAIPGHPCGTPLMSERDISNAIERCAALGLGLAAHAIGDGAVRAVLNAREHAAIHGGLRRASFDVEDRFASVRRALRIEHAELIDPADVPRFAALGVVASVQPCHVLYDIEVLARRLPHARHRVLPLRDLLTQGLVPGQTLLFGSDAPIVRADPKDSVDFAVHRRRLAGSVAGGETHEPIGDAQQLSEAQAWTCFDAQRSPYSKAANTPHEGDSGAGRCSIESV